MRHQLTTMESKNAMAVNKAQVARIAAILRTRFQGATPEQVKWDNPIFWNVEASRARRCQFLAIGNAINFRFWSLANGDVIPSTGVIDGTEYRGSMYMWRRLRLGVARGDFCLDAKFLEALTPEQFERAFSDDNGHLPLTPGLGDRIANLVDLGTQLENHWSGEFSNVIDAAEGSLDSFVTLSASFRAFDDPVQKLTMVNAIMLTGSDLVAFDPSPKPGIDYHLVKQAVRQGLVDAPLLTRSKLATGQLLTSGESLALRSATLEAVLAVADNAGISTAFVDNLYWLNRRICDETRPACLRDESPRCPFESACMRRTELGIPLEITRYY